MRKRALKDVGEFRLINNLIKRIGRYSLPRKPHIGVGDDSFVFGSLPGKELVVSTDALVSGVHFSERYMSWRSIGRKAMLVNLSDLAAMGKVKPLFAFISCGMPGSFPLKKYNELFRGLAEAASQYEAVIAGGDTVSSNGPVFISVTVIGEAGKEFIVPRSGAKQGDALFVSDVPGLSALGLYILKHKNKAKRLSASERAVLIKSHVAPGPRFFEANILAGERLATSMIDSSDGLDVCVREITRMSGVGAYVELDSSADDKFLRRVCGKLKTDTVRFCVNGGEDYLLVFTVPKSKVSVVMKKLPRAVKIGEITKKSFGVRYFYRGRIVRCHSGFEHFQ